MLEFLTKLDTALLIWINHLHTPWLDQIMFLLTDARTWTPFFLLIIGMMIYTRKWKTLTILLFLGLVVTISDQLASSVIKPWVGRLRPSHLPSLEGVIHLVNGYRGGKFSFVSSHASNSFGIATFLWLTLRREVPWIWTLFVWGAIFSFTRIYLGVHYPGDILGGALLGSFIGYLMHRAFVLLQNRLGSPAGEHPDTT